MTERNLQKNLDAEGRLRPPVEERGGRALRLEEQLRTAFRVRHHSHRTEDACWMWAKQFILFHGKRHPREMGAEEVKGPHLPGQSHCPAAGR